MTSLLRQVLSIMLQSRLAHVLLPSCYSFKKCFTPVFIMLQRVLKVMQRIAEPWSFLKTNRSISPIIKLRLSRVLAAKIPVVLYYGKQDTVCHYIGGREVTLANQLSLSYLIHSRWSSKHICSIAWLSHLLFVLYHDALPQRGSQTSALARESHLRPGSCSGPP